MVESEGKRFQGLFPDGRFQFAFPYHDRVPAHFSQFVHYLKIPLLIAQNLILPELGVRFRHNVVFASFMSVPEAANHKDDRTILAHHDVWMSRQSRMVQPVTEPMSKEIPPNQYLWFGILAVYRCIHRLRCSLFILSILNYLKL